MKTGEKSLTLKEVRNLLGVVTDIIHYNLIKLALVGGIRRADIITITKSDINQQDNSVMFMEKKKKRVKKVFLPQSLMNNIAMSMKINKKSPYLFPSKRPNKHISSKTAYNILQKYLKLAEIKSIPFHALRSTCYKLCQEAGWSPEQASKHLGDTVRVAQEHYATPTENEMKEVAESKEIL